MLPKTPAEKTLKSGLVLVTKSVPHDYGKTYTGRIASKHPRFIREEEFDRNSLDSYLSGLNGNISEKVKKELQNAFVLDRTNPYYRTNVALAGREDEHAAFRLYNLAKWYLNKLAETDNCEESEVNRVDSGISRLKELISSANIGLAFLSQKKIRLRFDADSDELLSEGLMSLLRAIECFDYEAGIKFSTYATNSIIRSIYKNIKKSTLPSKKPPKPILSLDSLKIEPQTQAQNDENRKSIEDKEFIRTLMSNTALTERERIVINGRFFLNDSSGEKPVYTDKKLTLEELGERIGLSKERVRQVERKAVEKLRNYAITIGVL